MVEGEAHKIQVCFCDYPVREANDGSGRRVELFPDFNRLLIEAIWDEIPDYVRFIADACNSPVQFCARVRDCNPIPFTLRVTESRSKRRFMFEMPDAVIDAFRRSAIG